ARICDDGGRTVQPSGAVQSRPAAVVAPGSAVSAPLAGAAGAGVAGAGAGAVASGSLPTKRGSGFFCSHAASDAAAAIVQKAVLARMMRMLAGRVRWRR